VLEPDSIILYRLLIDVVQNFHSGLDEISFQITEKMFKVRSFVDEDKRSTLMPLLFFPSSSSALSSQ